MRTPDWDLIKKCKLWKVLGVGECDICPDCQKCWGDDSVLPEPNEKALKWLEEVNE